MSTGYLCYHHHNDASRQAVGRCSKCGKALCQECVDTFRSSKNEILCGDCKKEELSRTYALMSLRKSEIRKELIFILIGFIIGLLAVIILASAYATELLVLIIWAPYVVASFGTFRKFKNEHSFHFIISLIMFVVFVLISPIMFIVRIVKRIKHIKQIKRYQIVLDNAFSSCNNYIRIAEAQKGENYYLLLQEQKARAQQLQNVASQNENRIADLQQQLATAKKSAADNDAMEKIRLQLEQLEQERANQAREMAEINARVAKTEETALKHEEEIRQQGKGLQEASAQLNDINEGLNAMV